MMNEIREIAEKLDYSGQRLNRVVRILSDEYSRLYCDKRAAISYAVEKCEGRCLYCDVDLYDSIDGSEICPKPNTHLDHIYPASYGGLFAEGNVAISCQSCNSSKSAKDPIEFYRDRIKRGQKCRFSNIKKFESFLFSYMKPYRDKFEEYYRLHDEIRESNSIKIDDIISKFLLHFDDIKLSKFDNSGEVMPTVSHSDDELIYDNEFNLTSLSLTPMGNSVLFAILLLAQKNGYIDDGNLSVDISNSEIREITGARNQQSSDIERILKSFEEVNLKYKIYENDGTVTVEPHKSFKEVTKVDKNLIRVKLSDVMAIKLQASDSQFTVINVREFSSIKSTYGQELYRLLSQFKGTGKFYIGVNQWKMRFDTPKSYSDYDIIRKQIIPAVKSNAPYFENLKVNVKEGDRKLPPTIFFTFTPQRIERIESHVKKTDDDSALLEYIKAHGGELK